MDGYHSFNSSGKYPPGDPRRNPNGVKTQIELSVALGLIAFLIFCFLRPRWKGLYAARKQINESASSLPELPSSFLGWMPVLYRISDEEVLASAGLDAYVFLAFFKMAIKFLAVALFFAVTVITPVHVVFAKDTWVPPDNSTNALSSGLFAFGGGSTLYQSDSTSPKRPKEPNTAWMWLYVVFVYFFSSLAIYLLITETDKIIKTRQEYLGSQSTITDRTIRLSGIPFELRSEDKIKDFVEGLEIGKVDNVTLCRDWKELDDLINERSYHLRKLEEALTVHLGRRQVERTGESLPITQPPPPEPRPGRGTENEESGLLDHSQSQSHVVPYERERPRTRIWYGILKLKHHQVDAIDYYEEKLRKLDEEIKSKREQNFAPTPFAFVTMDSIAACQMAVQAILDPSPLRLLAKPAPAPPDVVWRNTYLPRTNRMIRAWIVTIIIVLLTVFWSAILVPVDGLLSTESIHKVFPGIADALEKTEFGRALVTGALPTLVVSLLGVAVPYLYDWLANMQGMISQGDVELSVISKNFLFSFFNLFVFFTIIGTVTVTASELWGQLRDSLKDTTLIAYQLAKSLDSLALFYVNFIILQGLGLFPFRLLEFGSVALYPIYLIGAKTPRDYAELVQPPVFRYGFYLPQTILIFIVCIVYSTLQYGAFILFFGLLYFIIGHFTYKYQLLYAMDHSRHSTGQAWSIISYRVILGLVVFQLAMAGQLAIHKTVYRPLLIIPLLAATVWFAYYYRRNYAPLTRFIALRSIERHENATQEEDGDGQAPSTRSRRQSGVPESTIDEEREKDMKYVNPSLVLPLEEPWVPNKELFNLSGSPHNSRNGGDNNV